MTNPQDSSLEVQDIELGIRMRNSFSPLFFSVSHVKVGGRLTQDWMIKTLINLGFKQKEAQVYVYLAVNGPKQAKDIAKALNTYKIQVYRSLRKLESKEVVNANSSLPAEFAAVSFEKMLDILMKAATEQAKALQASRKELLATWRSMIEKYSENS